MLFAGREVRIGKNCARGLEYGPHVFIFFSLENYFIRNIFVDFLLQLFHTVRVGLTFRSNKPVLFTEVFKRRDSSRNVVKLGAVRTRGPYGKLRTARARGISQSDSRI